MPKCFEVRKCSEQERANCIVFKSYENPQDMEGVKCWIMFSSLSGEVEPKCKKCSYYLNAHKSGEVGYSIENGVAVVALKGIIGIDESKKLRETAKTIIDQKKQAVAVDLSHTDSITSMALGILVALYKELAAQRGRIFLVNPRPNIESLLTATKLIKIMPLAADVSKVAALHEKERQREEAEQAVARQKEQAERLAAKRREEERILAEAKTVKCWEFFRGHNPRNANTCEECYFKQSGKQTYCWLVEANIGGVSFQYVNEDCQDCSFFAKYGALVYKESIPL